MVTTQSVTLTLLWERRHVVTTRKVTLKSLWQRRQCGNNTSVTLTLLWERRQCGIDTVWGMLTGLRGIEEQPDVRGKTVRKVSRKQTTAETDAYNYCGAREPGWSKKELGSTSVERVPKGT